MDTVEEVLAHYGVKGMKWGVRKSRGPGVEVSSKGKKPLKVTGGEGHPAHMDAVNAAVARQKAKKSGIKSLSNAELKLLNDRLNLETQYVRLTGDHGKSKVVKAGSKFAGEVVAGVAKQQVTKIANDYASQQIAAMMVKKK